MRLIDSLQRGGLVAAAALTLSACQATGPKSLYYWGDYQPAVYAHFKGEAVEAQQQKLEMTAQQAQARGEALPPGFNAHLGLLYLNLGQLDRARGAFMAEATLYPESRQYMQFLLGRFPTAAAGARR